MGFVKSVFVSRPTWVPEPFVAGLRSFIKSIEGYGLVPKTLGVSDYPHESPLDEVIRLMTECSGAVILGYPQVWIQRGIVKETPITPLDDMALPTEWNHIEAGLAYALKRPLLLIHHLTVSRGIFARGAMNTFNYSVDLSDASWSHQERIQGAVKSWADHVLKVDPLKSYEEKAITMKYAERIGLGDILKKEGYVLVWANKGCLQERLDLDQYERIVLVDSTGKAVVLTGAKDSIPLKKKATTSIPA